MNIKGFLTSQGVISYLITIEDDAILIDPSVASTQEIIKYIKDNHLNLKLVLETHTHADFLSSVYIFKSLFGAVLVGKSAESLSKLTDIHLVDNQIVLKKDNIILKALATPGHTSDSMSYVVESDTTFAIFTGDTLLIGGTGRTDFQGGNCEELFASLQKILQYPLTTIIYPNHNYEGQKQTTLGVELLTNKRLQLVSQGKLAEFISLMKSHQPPRPDLFEESLRFNSI